MIALVYTTIYLNICDLLRRWNKLKLEYIFIKPEDEYIITKEMFQSFISTNNRLIFNAASKNDSNKKIILFDENELQYILESTTVEKSKEIIFHLIVELAGNEDEQANILEAFNSLIKEINENYGEQFSINTIWNDVSTYYANKLYPRIVHIENKLRKIIYLFMLKTVGSRWIDTGSPQKFQQYIESTIEKNGKKINEINVDWLTYADFITLGHFFTAPYSLKSDINALFKELEQYGDIENLSIDEKNIGKGDDKSGRRAVKSLTVDIIKKLSDEYGQKNNWDRYFSDKLSVKSPKKFSQDWSSLYNIRNKVAHSKPISKEDFDKANKLIDSFNKAFEECIEIIDSLEFTHEEAEAVEAVAQQVISSNLADTTQRIALSEDALGWVASKIPNWNQTINFPKDIIDTLSSYTIPNINSQADVKDIIMPTMPTLGYNTSFIDNYKFKDTILKEELISTFMSKSSSLSNLSETVKTTLDQPIFLSPLTENKKLINDNYNATKQEKDRIKDEKSNKDEGEEKLDG